MENHTGDPDLGAVWNEYVAPDRRHMRLLNGGVMQLGQAERAEFAQALAQDAKRVSDREITLLFNDDWRAQVTAAWLAGLTRRVQHRGHIRELLLASKLVNAGQGFCIALVGFGEYQDAQVLVEYLDRYLPRPDLQYDQAWALAALMYMDARLGTREAGRFLGGPWQQWAESRDHDLEMHRSLLGHMCSFAYECTQLLSGPDPRAHGAT